MLAIVSMVSATLLFSPTLLGVSFTPMVQLAPLASAPG